MTRPSVLPLSIVPRVTATQRVLLLSIAIGVVASLLIVCFHVAIDVIGWWLLGTPAGRNPVATLLAPALGGGLSALLVMFVFREAAGSGLTHTKAALYVADGHVPPSTLAGKFLACATSIGSGNSLGPEDPALQMGATVASGMGRLFALPKEQLRLIVPVGAAAGIAAAFNTPITAVLFVIEEVVASWNASVLGSIVLAAVSAVAVSRSFLGDEPLFRVPVFELTHVSELAVYAAIGLVGGVLAALFVRVLGVLRARCAEARRGWRIVQPFAAGALVGIAALWLPQVMGAGYGSVDSALHDEFGWRMLLALGVVKLIVTAACFAAGVPGGMFAPTLFTGAMIGGGVGMLAQMAWPFPSNGGGPYVLVGMGTFFAAVFRAPMTSIFMVFELSGSYVIIVPVMIANLIAYFVARQLNPRTFFEMVAAQDGLHLPSLERQRETPVLRVEDAMRAAPVGGEPAAPPLPTVYPDQSLDAAMRLFGGGTQLQVVSRRDARRVVGLLTLEDALRAYGIRAAGTPSDPDAS